MSYLKRVGLPSILVLATGLTLSACDGDSMSDFGGVTPPVADVGEGATPPVADSGGGSDPITGAPPAATGGNATLTWDAPTTRTDGTVLQDLVEYRISFGNSPGHYERELALDAADLDCAAPSNGAAPRCSFTLEDLSVAHWYFVVQAVDSAGNVSAFSNEAMKTVQ